MHQCLFVRDIQSKIITKLAEEGDADSRAALKAASCVGPFHEEAMAKSFAVLRVNVLEDAIALLYKACNVGQYVQTVHVGSKERAVQFDPRKLEELVALLPNARRIVLHPVIIVAPFVLPILSREYAFQSYVLVVSNTPQPPLRDVMPTIDANDSTGVFATNMRLALPADGTWSPEVTPERVEYLYTQGVGGKHGMEADLRYVRAIIPADAAVTVAFYPSTVMAAANFGRFLQTNGEKLTGIQILWTSAEGQLLDESLNHTLALGVAACTKLESITLGLFIGSNAMSTLEEQMSCLLALVQAARHKTLRVLSLVVRVHQDNEVYQYVQELVPQLERSYERSRTQFGENPKFLGIGFTVLGAATLSPWTWGPCSTSSLLLGNAYPIPVQPYSIPLLARF